MGWIKADLPDDVHRALKIEAARTDRDVQGVARDMIIAQYEDYVGDGVVEQAYSGGGGDD